MCITSRIILWCSFQDQSIIVSFSHHHYDNRVSSSLLSAPLIPLLRRFEGIHNAKSRTHKLTHWDEVTEVLASALKTKECVKQLRLYFFLKLVWKRFYLTFSESKHFTDKWITITIPLITRNQILSLLIFLAVITFRDSQLALLNAFWIT